MADPQHVPDLDAHDILTVRLYRSGLAIAALGLTALTVGLAIDSPALVGPSELLTLAGTALAVANMHLYAKQIRWVIGAAAWVGAVLWALGPALPAPLPWWVHHAALGFLFVALSAFALKEQFCFKLGLLRATPLFLATSLIPMVAGSSRVAAVLLAPAALLFLSMAWAKTRMPLHFDVGDKSKYQI